MEDHRFDLVADLRTSLGLPTRLSGKFGDWTRLPRLLQLEGAVGNEVTTFAAPSRHGVTVFDASRVGKSLLEASDTALALAVHFEGSSRRSLGDLRISSGG
jgi:hypothetical protein